MELEDKKSDQIEQNQDKQDQAQQENNIEQENQQQQQENKNVDSVVKEDQEVKESEQNNTNKEYLNKQPVVQQQEEAQEIKKTQEQNNEQQSEQQKIPVQTTEEQEEIKRKQQQLVQQQLFQQQQIPLQQQQILMQQQAAMQQLQLQQLQQQASGTPIDSDIKKNPQSTLDEEEDLPIESQVYSYQSKSIIFALGFSNKEKYNYRIGIGSFLEETDNQVQIIQLNEDTQTFEEKISFNHKYPPTKLIFSPDSGNGTDILATSGESLKIWEIQDNQDVRLKCDLINQNDFKAPLTSFDWNPQNQQLIGTASIDTTCTIWDIEKQTVYTQLIAHDKEVYDISFSQDKNLFASVGADGSARQFDLRNLEHSTVLYETQDSTPLLKLAWNRMDPKYVAVIEMDQKHVTLLDQRKPLQPVCKFNNHKSYVNALAWAPQSSCHLCTCADDSQALIWDLSEMKPEITDPLLEYKAEEEITNLSWSTRQNEWLAICFSHNLQILKVQ